MADRARYVGALRDGQAKFTLADALLPKLLFEAGAEDSRLHAIGAVNQNNAANTLLLYQCREMTRQADMGVGSHIDGGAGSDLIQRTAGDFVQDGWKVGDSLIVQGSTTRGNDFYTTLSTVTNTTLSFATGTTANAEDLPLNARLWRATLLGVSTLAINAGAIGTTPAVDLIGDNKNWTDVAPDRLITLPRKWALFAALGTALLTDKVVFCIAKGGDYNGGPA